MPTEVKFAFRREPGVIRALFFLAPFFTLLAPRTTVLALIVLAIGCVSLAVLHGQRLKALFRVDLGLALFALATLYLFLNATWSLDPSRAFGKATWFALVVLLSYAGGRALATWGRPQLDMAVTAFLTGFAVGVALILFEAASGRFLTVLLYNVLPFTRPESAKALVLQDGKVFRIAAFELNRNVTVMALMLWPALLCLTRLGDDKRRRLVGIAAIGLAVVATALLSRHESSKLGLLLSAIVFAVALPWPTFARRAIWIGWCLAFLLVLPLATMAFKAELHQAEWLPYSARARVTLWAYTAEQVPQAPILGIGISSTRQMDLDPETRLKAIEEKRQGEGYGWRAGPHSHNEFLQIWYELGAIGVVLFAAAGSVVILSVGRLPRPTQAFVLAHLTAFLAIAAFGWGMWQSWLMAVAGLAVLYAALAVSFYRATEPAGTASDA
jgi:O-antigen ligase